MSQNVCNICGANYEYHNGRWKCPACGAFKAEELSNEEVTLLYNAAQKLRLSDFDEAEKAYADIIEKFPKNPDGYWGRLLSRYGIKYEEDFDGRKIPTCYATSIESVITDKDYLKAIELADQETKAYYTLQAQYIESVRKEWVEKAKKEKPYDIFICYKDSDLANGIDRTQDSIAAQELYIHLTEQGYRVFFSRESLRGKVGEKYEPYIFNALSTAKVMLVYGSKSEYITSTWLKNEWTRYEKRLQAGEKKPNSLIVACDGFSPNELPKVLSSMQCFDATSRSFYTDLDAILKKIIKGEEKPKSVAEPQSKTEKKKSKALPITIAAISVVIAIVMCILLPSLLGDKSTATITDSKYGVVITADNEIFDNNTSVIVDRLSDGAQYTSLVTTVNNAKSVDIKNAIVYDIECDADITKNVTIKVAYSKSFADSTVKVYYVSDDKTLIEEHSCIYDEGFVEFKTNHLSYYVIGEIEQGNSNPSTIIERVGIRTITLSDKFTAEYVLEKWEGGSRSEASMIEVMDQYGAQQGGGKLHIVTPGEFVEEIDEWLFSLERKVGDYAIIENAYGYSLCYISSINPEGNGDDLQTEKDLTYEKGVLQVGVCANYEPYEYLDNGQFKGIEIDILKAIAAELGLEIRFENDTFEDLLGNLNSKDVDCIIGVTETAQRNELATASKIMFSEEDAEYIIYVNKDCTELLQAINNAIDKLNGNDTISGIVSAYKDITPTPTHTTISFNANGGSGTMASQEIPFNSSANLNKCTFTREGYTFAGWTILDGDEVVYLDEALYTTAEQESYTLYAVWVRDKFTVTFDSNGGTGSIDPIEFNAGDSIETPFSTFVKAGYDFIGWSTTKDGEMTHIEGATYKFDADQTLYAVWRASETTIKFNANGGVGSIDSIVSATGETISLTKNTFTRDGYTFSGWATSASGAVAYEDESNYTIGTDSEYTLYAVWSANTNALILKANNGTSNERTVNIKTGESKNIPTNNFTKSGYTFVGWSSTSNGSVEYEDGALYTMSSDAETLYAVWVANENEIIFNANDGSGSMTSQKIKTDETANLKDCTFTRNGYIFAGWATTSTGSVAYLDEAAYTMGANAQYTLYAIWTTADYKINYVLNEGSNHPSNPVGYDVTDSTITLLAPTRAGYTFSGWYSDSSFNTACSSIPNGSTGDKTFYASWTPNQNTITFNPNGGSGSMSNVKGATNSTITLPQNTFTRTGYEFKGWAIVSNGSVQYQNEGSYYVGTDSSYTLYAIWDVVNYSITYNTDGGTLSGQKTSYNVTTSTFTLPTPEKEDYIFLGWSGTGVSGVQKNVTVSKGSTGNRTYTANWELNAYTITLDANGGTVESETVTIKYGSNYTIAPAKRPGYTFLGWYGGTSSNSNLYTDGSGNSLSAWNKTQGATFYAQWKPDFSEGLEYKLLEGTINGGKVTAYEVIGIGTCTDKIIKLPIEIDGIPVVSVAGNAFANNTKIEGVVFPEALYINENDLYAHFNHYIGGVSLSVTSKGILIKDEAFKGCTNLKTVTLNCVSTIGKRAFSDCAVLEMVQINEETVLQYVGMYAFENCVALQTLVIPNSCVVIDAYAFSGASQLALYCEASAQPEEWNDYWNYYNATVYWDYVFNSFKVDLDYDGATGNTSVTYRFVENGNTYIFPIPTKTGYTFDGWYYGTTQITNKNGVTLNAWNISSSCTLKAKWNPNTDTAYTVNRYFEKANSNDYELQSETLYGTTGASITPAVNSYEHFTSPAAKSVTIKADGSLVVDYYYTRETFTVTFVENGGNEVSSKTYKYEQKLTDLPEATRTGYTFGGWFIDVNQTNSADNLVLYGDTNVYAWWEEEAKVINICYDGYVDGSEGVTIHGYDGGATSVVIPAYIGGLPVIAIADQAFFNNSSAYNNTTPIESIVIPDTVLTIGNNAFSNCANLTTVKLSSQITRIENSTFINCTSLISIELPSSVTYVDAWAFYNCSSLKTISLSDNISYLSGSALQQCSSLESVTIPSKLDVIQEGSFEGCTSLSSIVIPDTVSTIKRRAFYGCTGLKTVVIESGVSEIEEAAFGGCDSIEKMTLPFVGESLTPTWCYEATFGHIFGKTISSVISDIYGILQLYEGGNYYYYSIPSSIREVIITDQTVLPEGAFSGCDFIETITIPSTVTEIGNSAFKDCKALKRLNSSTDGAFNIPESTTTIGSSAFERCHSMIELILVGAKPKLNSMGSSAFSECINLERFNNRSGGNYFEIPSTISVLNEKVFYGCVKMENLAFHENVVTTIGDSAFSGCVNLTTINAYYRVFHIPSALTTIGRSAFRNVSNLDEIYIPETVTSVGYLAFDGCSATIKCRAEEHPDGWHGDWQGEGNTVIWFYIGDTWDGKTSYSFAGGTGTEEDPYLISTAEQLAYVATAVNQGVDTFKGKYLTLTTNLHLMNKEWAPIGTEAYAFEGFFDGGEYTIYGLKVSDETLDYGGLFGKIQDSTIANLTVKEANVKINQSYGRAGTIVGYGYSTTQSVRIINCNAEGNVTLSQCGYVGGIAGYVYGEISRSHFNGVVSGSAYNSGATIGVHSTVNVGGIAGTATTISDCYSEGTISGSGSSLYYHTSYAGGIAGCADSVSNCYSSANITSSGQEYSYAGGIVAKTMYSEATIQNCFSTGTIIGTSYSSSDVFCGRIVAKCNETDTITNCYADSTQTITKSSSTYGTLQFTHILQSENFIYNTLGWSLDIWQINEGGFPTLI